MQPIVGLLSDNSTSRFGRRRPFLLAGGFAVVGSFMCVGWTEEIVGLFFENGSPMVIYFKYFRSVKKQCYLN
jgi:solute carrier family 45 protein 1/2/4